MRQLLLLFGVFFAGCLAAQTQVPAQTPAPFHYAYMNDVSGKLPTPLVVNLNRSLEKFEALHHIELIVIVVEVDDEATLQMRNDDGFSTKVLRGWKIGQRTPDHYGAVLVLFVKDGDPDRMMISTSDSLTPLVKSSMEDVSLELSAVAEEDCTVTHYLTTGLSALMNVLRKAPDADLAPAPPPAFSTIK